MTVFGGIRVLCFGSALALGLSSGKRAAARAFQYSPLT